MPKPKLPLHAQLTAEFTGADPRNPMRVSLSPDAERELAAYFGAATLDQARIEFESEGMPHVVVFSLDTTQSDPYILLD